MASQSSVLCGSVIAAVMTCSAASALAAFDDTQHTTLQPSTAAFVVAQAGPPNLPPARPGTLPPSTQEGPPAVQAPARAAPQLPPQPSAPAPAPVASPPTGDNDADKAFAAMNRVPANREFPTDDYNFGPLMARIYSGELKSIPDDEKTRAVVVSVVSVINEQCGERDTESSYAAMRYGSKQMRELERDPTSVFKMVLLPYAQMVQRFNRGDIVGGLEAFSGQGNMIAREGVQDGQLFVGRHNCSGKQFSTFVTYLDQLVVSRSRQNPAPLDDISFSEQMSDAFRKSRGIPHPAVARRERQLQQFASTANDSCVKQYADKYFCTCLTEKIRAMQIDDPEWESIGGRFTNVAQLGTKYPDLRGFVRACNK